MSTESIMLKVRLVDKKVFKKFQFYPKKSVKDARLFIAKEMEVDPEQYGLFLPPRDDQNGIWFRDDYPLDFYGLEGETDQKEALLFSSKNEAPLMEFVEFKKRYRPIKVAKGDNQYKTVMVDDTMNVAEAITHIITHVPVSAAINENELYNMSDDEVEVLTGDMTIREQGYVGECTTGLLKTEKGEINLYVKVPYFEGWIMRKRGGSFMKGLKNWNKRWYTLKKNKLVYHKAKGFGPEMGCILMKTVQAVRPCTATSDIPTKYSKSCFEVVTPARTFVMLASNQNEMKKWVEILDFSRRMFAYETHFFGVANKSLKEDGRMSLVIGKKKRGGNADEDDDDETTTDEEDDDDESEEDQKVVKLKKQREQEEEVQRVKKAKEEEIRQVEEKKRVQEEEERRRVEEERIAEIKRVEEEQEIKRVQEEQELQRKQEEFLAKQQQLELEKQKQLQDQLEEDRRLEELMLQMELEQEERIKLKEEQERLEKEREEVTRRLEEEQEKLKQERDRLEKERIETEERIERERLERIEREEEEKKRQEEEKKRQEEERVERERVEKQRVEKERVEQEERQQRLLIEEEQERERLEKERQDEEDLMEQIEKEQEEEDQRQQASRRLQPLQARLAAIEEETPELKFLLAQSSKSTPENLLLAWANYIVSDSLGPQKSILSPKQFNTSSEANLELYSHLLNKLEPQSFKLEEFKAKNGQVEKAEYIVESLKEMGVETITTEQVLSTDETVHMNVLLTIYEEIGSNWQEEFQSQLVSKRVFASKYIYHALSAVLPHLNIPSSPYEMLQCLRDGTVLCHLINKIFKGTIDERVIQNNIDTNNVIGNLYIAVNASRALGAKHSIETKNIDLEALNPLQMHSLSWEVVELCLMESANPSRQRSLFNLMRAETRNAFRALDREKVLMRWFNYHLRKICNRQINNFSDDMEDCENYAYLFEQIAPQISRKKEILAEKDWEKRAEIVIDMASKLGCLPLLTARDIVETENSKLNLLFVADILRVCPALPSYNLGVDEQLDDFVAKSSEQSNNNDTMLIQWINSMELGVPDVTNLLEDLKDGSVFLRIFDKVSPAGTVDPKKLKVVANSVFKKLELCNHTMECCHKLKLNVAGIAGTDLLNGDLRANRAILLQIRRFLGDKVTVDVATLHQAQALKWANNKIHVDSKVKHIQSFKDQFLQDSLFFLALLDALVPNRQDRQNIISPAQTEEQMESNAKYFLTLAWSATIPLHVVWEDVVKVRSKSIKHIIETLQDWDKDNSNQ